MDDKFIICKNLDSNILKRFYLEQITDWQMLRENLDGVKNAELKKFEKNGYTLKIQYNTKRIVSTTAKVDSKSITTRKCFLCAENLYLEQKGLIWNDKFFVLCNPFPIFDGHFVISSIAHQPQNVNENFLSMLELSKILTPDFTIIYNGPKCGASAPDHMHFQAGTKNFMPIDTEIEKMALENVCLVNKADTKIYGIRSFERRFFYFKSISTKSMCLIFERFLQILSSTKPTLEEPMLNIITSFDDGEYRVIAFPRGAHRPWQYFENGNRQVLISPASVDFGGVFIAPRKEDFAKLTLQDLENIFQQTSIDETEFINICNLLERGI